MKLSEKVLERAAEVIRNVAESTEEHSFSTSGFYKPVKPVIEGEEEKTCTTDSTL